MADEAVNPAPEEEREHRWGASGYAGEWVRAADIGVGERVRWIGDDGAGPSGEGERPARDEDRKKGTDHPGA